MERLLIILCGRRANMCGDGRARPNRAIASIGAEAYRDNIIIQRPFRYNLIAKDRTKSLYVQNLCVSKFSVGFKSILNYAVFV